MKKVLIVLYILFAGYGLLCPLNTWAKVNSITDDNNYVIPSDYAFTPKFIRGITKFETSDSYNRKGNGNQITVNREEGYSNYWAIYKNVGIWRHHTIDMKITLEDVVDTDSSQKCAAIGDINDEDIISVYFYPKDLAVRVDTNCRSAGTMGIFKIEFFDNETGENLNNLKSVLTYDDIDSEEQIAFDNNHTKDQYYYKPYGVEHLDLLSDKFNNRFTLFKGNNLWTCRSNGIDGDVNCFDDSSIVQEGSCYQNNCEGCYKAGMITVLNDGTFTLGWSGYYTGFSATGFLRIDNPAPMKFVDKEVIKPGEQINYTIEQYMPNQAIIHYYKTWKITDQLENILETNVDNITITDDEGENLTDRFNITIENNILTVSIMEDQFVLSEIYNKTFIINIKATVKNDVQDIREITNHAVLNIEYNDGSYSEDIPSNEVKTTIEKDNNIVEVPNTAKFTSMIIYIVGIIFIASGIFIIFRTRSKEVN